jgi:hypothetical protein
MLAQDAHERRHEHDVALRPLRLRLDARPAGAKLPADAEEPRVEIDVGSPPALPPPALP